MQPLNIADACVFLDSDTGARSVPIDAQFWPDLISGRLGAPKRLVASFSFDKDWESWERHPAGEELVMLLDGDADLILETDGGETRVTLDQPGSYVLVPANTWHTARVRAPTRMLFITPGEGTENRRG